MSWGPDGCGINGVHLGKEVGPGCSSSLTVSLDLQLFPSVLPAYYSQAQSY